MDTWTINAVTGSNLLGSNNIPVLNGSINLSTSVQTTNALFTNFNISSLIIPNNSITQTKITN